MQYIALLCAGQAEIRCPTQPWWTTKSARDAAALPDTTLRAAPKSSSAGSSPPRWHYGQTASSSCDDVCVITIETVSGADASAHRDGVLAVWTAAFGLVNDPDEWAVSPWDRHRSRPGYRLTLAHDGARLVGFAWGYTGERGQYWSDAIVRELGSKADEWVDGHFEFVELAVIPEARQRGIGGQLHDALLADLDHRRALLATSRSSEDPAVRLYSSRGWVGLASYGDDRQVMGRVLHE